MSFSVQSTTFAISEDQFAILNLDFEITVMMIAMTAGAETEQVAGHSLSPVGVVSDVVDVEPGTVLAAGGSTAVSVSS